jgi:virulence factor Mce-like protein
MIEVRDRLTEGLNRARLKLELRRSISPLVVLAIGALIGIGCWYVLAKNVGPYIYKSTREVSFTLDNGSGIVPGRQEVRFKGVPAGIISKLDNSGPKPVATVKLYSSFGPIYRDARATLRPNTALEDMYIDIVDRGTKAAGVATANDPLPARQVQTPVQTEDVLQAFAPDVRAHLAAILSDLGGGLQDRGRALRAAFVKILPFLDTATRLSTQLAERSRLTKELVHNTALLTGELGRRERALRTLARAGGTTLQTIADRSPQLDSTLRELPPTLSAIDTSFSAVRGVLPDLDRALVSLRPVAEQLPAGLAAVRKLSAWATPAVRKLRPPVDHLRPLAHALVPAAANLESALTALRPQIPAIDHTTKTVAGCMVPIEGFFQWTPSTTKFSDARGMIIRGDAAFSFETSGEVNDPNVRALPSCAPGTAIGGEAGPGGDLTR